MGNEKNTLEDYLNVIKTIMESRLVVDRFGNIISVNHKALELFGYAENEILGKPIEILIPISSELHKTYRDKYIRRPEPKVMSSDVLFVAKKKDGTVFHTNIVLTPLYLPDLYVIVGILDVTNLVNAYDESLMGWAKALKFKDISTGKHTLRVAQMTVKFCRLLGFDDSEIINVWRGAILHDIGKMGIPDFILKKDSKLTDEEFDIMKQHPMLAKEMLDEIDFLKYATPIPYYHHERWDGTGYPNGLFGAKIPLEARAFSIIDVYDALSNNRSYRKAWEKDACLEYIKNNKGVLFDPVLVDIFLENVDSITSESNHYERGGVYAS